MSLTINLSECERVSFNQFDPLSITSNSQILINGPRGSGRTTLVTKILSTIPNLDLANSLIIHNNENINRHYISIPEFIWTKLTIYYFNKIIM